jgi:hypothetical protein
MPARLDDALYWFGLIVAYPLLLLAVVQVFTTQPGDWFFVVLFGLLSAAAWLAGR